MRYPQSRATPGPAPGVFVWLLLACWLAPAQALDCAPSGQLERVSVAKVVDGDTVVLGSGDSVRLIGINAPERGRDGRPGEPLAQRARRELERLTGGGELFLAAGILPRDRYGRRLAHLYRRADGGSVEAELLRLGLGFQVTVPPDSAHSDCFIAAEGVARRARRGVWSEAYFEPREATALTPSDAGFRRTRLTVREVSRNRAGWWIESGALAVLIPHGDREGFEPCVPECWRGHTLVVRGWLVDRSAQRVVRERGYPPLKLTLRHAAMVERWPQ